MSTSLAFVHSFLDTERGVRKIICTCDLGRLKKEKKKKVLVFKIVEFCHLKFDHFTGHTVVSRFGLAVRRWAGKQRDLGSNPLRLSFLFKVVVCGHCLVTLSLTVNETLKWLSSLPALMPESFWW